MGKLAPLLKNKRVLAIAAGVTTLLAGSGAGAAYWFIAPALAKEAICFEWCEPLLDPVRPTTLTHLVFPAKGEAKPIRLFMADTASCESVAAGMVATAQKGRPSPAPKCETVAVKALPPPEPEKKKAEATAGH